MLSVVHHCVKVSWMAPTPILNHWNCYKNAIYCLVPMLLLKQNKESNSSAIFRIKSLNKITHLPPKTKIMYNNWSSREKMPWQKFYHILLIWMTIFQFQYMNHTSSKEKKIMPNCNQLVTIPARTSLLPNCNQLVYQTDCIKPSIQGFPRVSKLIHGLNLNMVSWCETK